MTVRRADPIPRRRALVVLGGLAFAGAATIALVRRELGDPRALSAPEAAAQLEWLLAVLAAVLGCAAILLAGGAWALWRIGRRTLDSAQFPPPGIVVLRDVTVIEGVAARRRGSVLMVVAAILVASALAIAVVGGWLIVRLGAGS